MIKINAYAKINLTLDITGKKENGYHLISTIMQSISLHDILSLDINNNNEILINTSNKRLPIDNKNLAYKAAELFKKITGINSGVIIEIKKNIPISAGLAGGSADAAAVLIGLNKLFNTKLTSLELSDIGKELGSDIPFCINGGTCICEGLGDEITPLPPIPQCYILLSKPPIGMSTQIAYSLFDELNVTEPPINNKKAIESIYNNDLDSLCIYLGNKLQTVTERSVKEINEIIKTMQLRGAKNAIMSGSGTAVFGIYNNRLDAEKCLKQLNQSFMNYIVTPYNRGIEIIS